MGIDIAEMYIDEYLGREENSDYIEHYGMPRRSGRYPWGSGEKAFQRRDETYRVVKELRATGMNDTDIAKSFGLSTGEFRSQMSIARVEARKNDERRAAALKAKGYSNVAIGKKMGINDTTVRLLLKPSIQKSNQISSNTASQLKEAVDEKGLIDIGTGVEIGLGISRTKLNTAVQMLENEGYTTHNFYIPQATDPSKNTTVKVLAPPGMDYKEAARHIEDIQQIQDYSPDGGKTFSSIQPPSSIDSSRIFIRYGDQGGKEYDGTIELRRGVDDLSLGSSNYAQVRIGVDNKLYMKGMALYSDDIPDGYDAVFNTNKKSGTPIEKVLKPMKDDPNNRFGALIKNNGQSYYEDETGDYVNYGGKIRPISTLPKDADISDSPRLSLGAVNKIKEEGDWSHYSKSLASQFLGKQHMKLIDQQLNASIDAKNDELNEILSLTNPEVKRRLLTDFADQCDSDAVKLKAVALPRQTTKVILPVKEMNDDEIYAPEYRDGEKIALVRYPHGGTFEIPVLTVNNKFGPAIRKLGDASDAVGINSNVAEQLSGADFDGDTVVCIPCNNIKIKHQDRPASLKDFDSKDYKFDDASFLEAGKGLLKSKNGLKIKSTDEKNIKELKRRISEEGYQPTDDDISELGKSRICMSKAMTQMEMGKASNLITDMHLKGASTPEIVRATKYSMVVIDAHKHELNYKQAYIDYNISELREKYCGGTRKGAATLLSRAKSPEYVEKHSLQYDIDPDTGKKIWRDTQSKYGVDYKTGETFIKKQKSSKMAEADTPEKVRALSSGTEVEERYADYAISLKDIANKARKESLNVKDIEYSPKAAEEYAAEVESLKTKLKVAQSNTPKERQSQIIANSIIRSALRDNPELRDDKAEQKKIRQKALTEGRDRTGANKQRINLTDREFEAMQSGAVSKTFSKHIVDNCDMDVLKEKSMPRESKSLSSGQVSRLNSMLNNSRYTSADIADALGISVSTVNKYKAGDY